MLRGLVLAATAFAAACSSGRAANHAKPAQPTEKEAVAAFVKWWPIAQYNYKTKATATAGVRRIEADGRVSYAVYVTNPARAGAPASGVFGGPHDNLPATGTTTCRLSNGSGEWMVTECSEIEQWDPLTEDR